MPLTPIGPKRACRVKLTEALGAFQQSLQDLPLLSITLHAWRVVSSARALSKARYEHGAKEFCCHWEV